LPPFKIVTGQEFNVNSQISSLFLFNPMDEKVGNSCGDAWFADFVPYLKKSLAHFFPSVRVTEQVSNFVGNPF